MGKVEEQDRNPSPVFDRILLPILYKHPLIFFLFLSFYLLHPFLSLSFLPLFPLSPIMKFLSLALTLLPTFALSMPLEIKRAGTSLPNPLEDPFYKVPSNIASYSAGQVVQKRDVETNIEGKNVASSYQVSYRSLTTKQNPDLTVATIWTPTKPADPVRIFSYQAYE